MNISVVVDNKINLARSIIMRFLLNYEYVMVDVDFNLDFYAINIWNDDSGKYSLMAICEHTHEDFQSSPNEVVITFNDFMEKSETELNIKLSGKGDYPYEAEVDRVFKRETDKAINEHLDKNGY